MKDEIINIEYKGLNFKYVKIDPPKKKNSDMIKFNSLSNSLSRNNS